MTARRINDSYIVPVSFPITPLPPVDAEESVLPSNEPDGIAPTQPADIALPPLGPALPSDRGFDVDDESRGAPKPEFSSTDEGATPQARDIKPRNPNATNRSPNQEESTTLPPKFAAAYAVRPRGPHATNDGFDELSGPSEPTSELIALARPADTPLARGFKSAERGAIYTARAELVQALRTSAAALDAQRQTSAHSRALVAGLRALDEVQDFLPAHGSVGQPFSVAVIAAGHQTPVLDELSLDELTPAEAVQRYLTYAQERLACAGGDLQPAASALYALGKLDMAAGPFNVGSLEAVRAVVYFQAALIIHPRNALAANELGVLLARHGRLPEARSALLYSVKIEPQPAAWRNLSIVHHHLGEMDLARRADSEARQSAQRQQSPTLAGGGKAPQVAWVDPETFNRSGATQPQQPSEAGSSATAAARTANPATGGNEASAAGKNASRWAPWLGGKRQ